LRYLSKYSPISETIEFAKKVVSDPLKLLHKDHKSDAAQSNTPPLSESPLVTPLSSCFMVASSGSRYVDIKGVFISAKSRDSFHPYPSLHTQSSVQSGKWFFGVVISSFTERNPIHQIPNLCVGWCMKGFFGDASNGKGVGDDIYSVGLDDQNRWRVRGQVDQKNLKKGEPWKENDHITSLVSFTRQYTEISFYVNEKWQSSVKLDPGLKLFPAISIRDTRVSPSFLKKNCPVPRSVCGDAKEVVLLKTKMDKEYCTIS